MAGILKKNIKTLKKYYPYVQVMLGEIQQEYRDEVLTDVMGKPCFSKNNNTYPLCSRYPENEAELLTRGIDWDKDNLIIVFGIGNIKLLEAMMEKRTEDTRIAVFEPNINAFQYVIHNYDITQFVETEKIVFFTGEIEIFEKYLISVFNSWTNLVLNMVAVSLPNYHLYKEYRIRCMECITKNFQRIFANMGNSLEDTLIGIDNQYVNADYCMESNSLREIQGKYKGYPAIIVSSGPSLDKNIGLLKEAEGKALIITCDASYKACQAHGVRPDMIASIERGIATYQFYYEKQTFPDDLVLIGPSVLRPEIFQKVHGKKIILAKSAIGVEGWWKRQFDSVEISDSGHSCATVAFWAAYIAGCSPIILIGQDLAYTDDKIHGSMAHTEYEGENKKKESSEIVWTKDIYGNPISTSKTYNTFRYYFEEKIISRGISVVDATEGGALIAGSKVMPLKEAIDTYCNKTVPFKLTSLLSDKEITIEERIKKYRQIKKASEEYIKKLEEIQKKVLEFREGIIGYKDYNFNSATQEELTETVEVMANNNQVLNYLYSEHKDMLTYYMQNIKQTVINVKNLGNKLNGENVRRNWELQVNLLEMIHIASSAVIMEFAKIVDFMAQKEEDAACMIN